MSRAAQVTALGADRVILRDADPLDSCGREVADGVVDVVGGSQWPALLDVIKRGGPYAVAGAIAGPLVTLDLRTLYLTASASSLPETIVAPPWRSRDHHRPELEGRPRPRLPCLRGPVSIKPGGIPASGPPARDGR